ncbi:MAG: EAL domain-containing protein [Lachnospiraceae bacterium]|nr:EAL domain-containing protein [Lachnospiraceae bacterium]
MQKALDEKQFVVYLQPKFSLSTERACGAEALVRWMHPVKGLVSPGEFIPVFEKNGFISKLDYYVWEQTCHMLQGWMEAGRTPYPVSVNISRISLYNPQLVDLMKELVEKYNIPPVLLQLEVTESAYMSNPELMEETIKQLHDAGFTILMDDFGSGYSSLNTLKRIQVDVLKVDMKFLPVKDETERGEIILASVIKMANWLGMSVVVEGVETRQQRDFLEGAGCDCVQGYYYARPVPQAEYEEKYLNAAVTENMASIQEDPSKDIGPQHNMTILVIDDSETDLTLLKENFKDLYHMHMCESGEEGLAYLKRNRGKVRLILVDNVMPGMSGLEFLRYCQQDSTLSVIPKIMITANDTVADQVEAFKEGAYDYITKPLVMEVVAARINHVMAISCHTSIFDTGGAEYNKKANLDVETQLFNKMAFREFGTRVIDSFPDDMEALMVLDIDNFKQINDRYGHLAGDTVIRCVADELLSAFRNTDIVGRFGGDEFVVLMTRIPNMEIAKRKAAELVKNVLLTCTKQLNINASISIGLAFSEEGDTMDTLFARADQALYEAKNSGRAKVVVYGEEVPPIKDDDKPIVLVCGEDPQLYPTIALAYGTSAAFTSISSYDELVKAFENYGNRIRVICMDTEKKVMKDSDKFYQYILEHGGGTIIPILAVYREGSMEQLREAMELNVFDIFTLPPQMDVIQRRLSRAIMRVCANEDE